MMVDRKFLFTCGGVVLLCVLILLFYQSPIKQKSATSGSSKASIARSTSTTMAPQAVDEPNNHRTNQLLKNKFIQYFSLYPMHFESLPSDLKYFVQQSRRQKVLIRSDNSFGRLLYNTICVGKVLLNSRLDIPAHLLLTPGLRIDLSVEDNKKLYNDLYTYYSKTLHFLLDAVKVPTNDPTLTPFNFSAHHFEVTLPMLYAQAMVTYQNVYLSKEILKLVPKPNQSWRKQLDAKNILQMSVPYVIATCYEYIQPALHTVNATPLQHGVKKVMPINYVQMFIPSGNELAKAPSPEVEYSKAFLDNVDERIYTFLVDHFYSRTYSDHIRQNALSAASVSKDGIDIEGGFLSHGQLRTYNYYVALFDSYLFYQMLYNVDACGQQFTLDWVPKVIHFEHKYAMPSISGRNGNFLELYNSLSTYLRIFREHKNLSTYQTDAMKHIGRLDKDSDRQTHGFFMFERAQFMSCIFRDWSTQIVLQSREYPYGEVDRLHTQIVQQSTFAKIMLRKEIPNYDAFYQANSFGYPGVLYSGMNRKHAPNHKLATRTLYPRQSAKPMYGFFRMDGTRVPITPNFSVSDDHVFVSYTQYTINRFGVGVKELVVVSKYGLIVGYLDLTEPVYAGTPYQCCIHRWPGIHTEYLTFDNCQSNSIQFKSNLTKANYYEQKIESILVNVDQNIVYTNMRNASENVGVEVTVTCIDYKTEPTYELHAFFPQQPKPFKIKIKPSGLFVQHVEIK